MLFVLVVSLSISCGEDSPKVVNKRKEVHDFYKGEHLLRKLDRITINHPGSEKVSAWFVLIGGYYGKSTTPSTSETKLVFYWQGNDGAYTYTSVPLIAARIKINDSIKNPTVQFVLKEFYDDVWFKNQKKSNTTSEMTSEGTQEIIITCDSSAWPIDVQVPN